MLANLALMFGFVAVLVHTADGFTVHEDIEMARWSLSPVFFGVVVGYVSTSSRCAGDSCPAS